MFGKRQQHRELTFLGSGSEFEGNFKTRGSLRVDGTVRGRVEAGGDVEISGTGAVEGPEVRGRNILVYGRVNAKVTAEGKLTLTRTAHLEGDVVASALEIEEGAFYVGYIVTKEPKALPVAENPRLLGADGDATKSRSKARNSA